MAFATIFAFSGPFEYGSGMPKPTLLVTTLLLLSTAITFWSVGQAIQAYDSRKLLFTIVMVGISLRLVGLVTCPILEIDYYRYLWDGKVLAQGVSPYQYTPGQILKHGQDSAFGAVKELPDDSDLGKLIDLSVASPSNNTIVSRIHFEEYSSIYPPVSQLVFGTSMKWFPDSASVAAHIFFIKATLVGFDLMILGVVFWLLSLLKIHTGWSIAYAWNPLVLKEISNGGHLDSIAAFFLILSISLLAKWFAQKHASSVSWLPALSGISLGLGVGAKLFPIVLFPALFVSTARVGWSKSLVFGIAFAVAAGLSFYPMYCSIIQTSQNIVPSARQQDVATATTVNTLSQNDQGENSFQSVAENQTESGKPQPRIELASKKEGLTSFLSRWRMNDVIFSGIYLNLKPTAAAKSDLPWYVVTTSEFRAWAEQQWERLSPGSDNPAFSMTRVLTLGPFLLFYLWQLVAIYRGRSTSEDTGAIMSDQNPYASPLAGDGLIESSGSIQFNRLVWILVLFLFLQPTVNPWYWVWVAPLTVLTKNRGWILAGGLLLIYYSRFWFESLPATFEIAGYSGVGLFDHGVAWIEFVAVFGVIAITGAYKAVRQ